jgi:hypothetical protein
MELYFTTLIHLHTERSGFDLAVLGTPISSDLRILSGFLFPQGEGTKCRHELGHKLPPSHHSMRFLLRYYGRR